MDEAWVLLKGSGGISPGLALSGVTAGLAGLLLLAGVQTHLASVALAVLLLIGSVLPRSSLSGDQFNAALPEILAGGMAGALLLLGPGAFSVDARLYGRREILIRPARRAQ